MGRKIIILLSMCLMTTGLWSQSATEQINAIKWQPSVYLMGEATEAKQEDALNFAKTYIRLHIKSWRKVNGLEVTDDIIEQTADQSILIEARRGSMYRAFYYIPIADVAALFGIDMAPAPAPDPDPVYQAPAPAPEPEPVYQAPAPEPAPMPAPAPQPIVNEYGDDGVMDDLADEAIFIPTPLEEDMMKVTQAQGIQAFIKKLEAEYKISRYGKYSDMPADINCYLFVYDRSMNIPAYLRKEGSIYINLKTGEIDDITNYKGCGAIWFRIKN